MAESSATKLAQVKLATKADIFDLIKKTDFDVKLKKMIKKVPQNTATHLEAEKKLTDLTKRVAQISEKKYGFLLGRTDFTGGDNYQNFLVFASILSSIALYINKKSY